jgi:peptide/nickel transport system permease protein
VVVTFAVIHLAPGDPVLALAGEGADPARLEELRLQYGLDKPLVVQFFTYAAKVLRGDLGDSFSFSAPVTDVIRERLGPTLLLMGVAIVFASAAGILLGVLAARRPFGSVDLAVSVGTLLFYSLPAFWLAQLAILVFALHFGMFPLGGITDARIDYTGLAHVRDVSYHMILPAAVLAASEVALLCRVTRTGLIEQMDKDYARTARAKGLTEHAVLSRHILPNALLPVVTIIGTRVGFLFSGAVVIENVFAWPGLGTLIVSAAKTADRPLMLGMVLLVGVSVILANLLTDLAYAWVDPRVRNR